MPDPYLEIDGLVCGYDGGDVLRGISLSLPKGAVISVIGPNGHGKSTLLKATSGLLRARSGDIRLAGRSIRKSRVEDIVAQGVAHIPQGDMIFPQMSVLDNLLMGAHLPDVRPKARDRLEEVFATFPKLRDRQDQLASTLSGGERRMLGIGRGLMLGSGLLMIDEPSLGLSPLVTDQIYDVIRTLKSQGRTILLVEENASRTIGLADWVYLLDHGEFVWEGRSETLNDNQEILTSYFGG
ncbi:ABC transporter ATP-binding protein [Marinibacterium sp. SX1]|uniref:ABC transporter ATP-binding protein n=1 Tax=Marinibacterium sp. SX1 TaxID=3388424 RepID=UPI003D171592